MKKSWWLLALMLGLPLAYAGPLEVLEGAWQKFLSVGNLSFIGISGTVPFTRILIWILCFTLFFAVITGLGAAQQKPFGFFKRTQSIVVAAVLATISAVFLPASAILAVGAGWATAVALLLIGGPIFGYWYFIWKWPGKDQETKMTVVIKLILSMILFWILSAMNNEVKIVGPSPSPSVAGTMAQFLSWALFIVSLMTIWYLVKIFWVTTPEEKAKQEQEWGEKGAALRKWAGDKWKEKEAEEQMSRKKDLASPVKDYVIKAMGGLSEVEDSLNDLKGDKAKKQIDEVQDNLRKAVRGCKMLMRNLEEAGDKDAVIKIITFLQTTQKDFLDKVKDNVPANINSRADIKAILDNFETLRGSLGNVFKELETLYSKK